MSSPLPPGQLGLPWLGETLSFLGDPAFARKRQQRYGNLFKSRILGQPTVFFCGPEANEFLLASHAECFSWRGGWPNTFQELLGESLFLQEGEIHRRNRRLLMPAFHGAALEGYFATMQTIALRYLARWEAMGELTWFAELKQFTFEVACVLLLGATPEARIQDLSAWFSDLTNGLFTLPLRWGPTPYRRALRGRDRLLQFVEQTIAERRAALAKETEKSSTMAKCAPIDVLTLLLQTEDEAGNRLSEEEIKVQALLMLFAGHETTTSMLTSLMMALAQNPTVLEKARAEQSDLMAEGSQPKEMTPLSWEHIQRMPYLDQVLKEVERQYPPIGGGFRRVVKAFDFMGYHVPVGWLALYRIEAAHLDPRCYDQPERFDPERFNPQRAEHKRFGYSLVGFGGGPRICLGMAFAKLEMKLLAALLLRHYQWALIAGQDLTLKPVPSLRPADGLRVRFAPL